MTDDEAEADGRRDRDDQSTRTRDAASDVENCRAIDPVDSIETAERGDVTARYEETQAERVLGFEREGATAAVAQNRDGYAMLKVRTAADGDELERYYGFDVALDHVGELLEVDPTDLPVPDAAADMGM